MTTAEPTLHQPAAKPQPPRWSALRQRLAGLWSRVDAALEKRFARATREERTFYALVPVVGLLAGALGLAVHWLIGLLRRVLWGEAPSLLDAAMGVPPWQAIVAPLAGGAMIGLIAWLNRGRLSAEGMGLLIEAVVLRGGRVPARPVLVGALGAIATVGSGGSLGKEGPMIRLGATLSSWLGAVAGLGPHRSKILLACGAAAGMAAAYNVPIGGALFAMEVILGNFALDILGPIVVAAVISTMLARTFEGNEPLYPAVDLLLDSPWDLLGAVALGVIGGFASLAFTFGVRWARRFFTRTLQLPESLKPMVGMGMLGVGALWVPHVLGSGIESINLALDGDFAVQALLVLIVAKLLATALTVGCGGTGGLFTPSLFIGAMVGGLFGYGFDAVNGTEAMPSGAWAAVGMAAMIAGTGHAPITAILMLFEFTGNYGLILPIMLAAISSSAIARWISPYSSYTEALEKAGVDLRWRMEEAVLAGVRVRDVMRAESEALAPDMPFAAIVERFLATARHRLFVVESDGRLLGEVALHDIKPYLGDPAILAAVVAHDLMHPVGHSLDPDARLNQAAEVFSTMPWERLPVVDVDGRLVGLLAKRDLLTIYAQEVMGRPQALATFVSRRGPEAARDHVELPPDYSVRLIPVPAELIGRTLAAAELTRRGGVRVLELKRRERGVDRRLIPEASTTFEAGDGLIVLGPSVALEALAGGVLPALDDAAVAAEPARLAGAATFLTGPGIESEREEVSLPPATSVAVLAAAEPLVGASLAELELTRRIGVRILEVRRVVDGEIVRLAADAATRLAAGDELVAFGAPAGLELLRSGALPDRDDDG